MARLDRWGAAYIAGGAAMRDTSKFLKEQQTTDALIRRAFAGYRGRPVPVPMPPPRPVRGALPPGPVVTPPPADASFVRSVPGQYPQSERLALPAGRGGRPMAAPEASGVTSRPARSIVQRDPRTGRMRRVYVSE